MALGDNLNDAEMLAYAGLPIVMDNSVPELKALGWHEDPSPTMRAASQPPSRRLS